MPTLPPPTPNGDFGAYLAGKNTAVKAKTSIDIPAQLFRIFANITTDATYGYVEGSAWPRSASNEAQKYGIFAPIHTAVLAFGSIPVTATVHLTQPVSNNQITPFAIHAKGLNNYPYTGGELQVRGDVNLRISDIAVDGIPLNVGPNCHTSAPLHLVLSGKYYNHQDAPPGYYNIYTGGLLTGSTTIPPFAGCRSGSENLNPLLTGMISGPNNPVRIVQGHLAGWQPPDSCPACPPLTISP